MTTEIKIKTTDKEEICELLESGTKVSQMEMKEARTSFFSYLTLAKPF